MSVLIIAEPTTGAVKPATLTTVGAAAKLDGDLHVLVIGVGPQTVFVGILLLMLCTIGAKRADWRKRRESRDVAKAV